MEEIDFIPGAEELLLKPNLKDKGPTHTGARRRVEDKTEHFLLKPNRNFRRPSSTPAAVPEREAAASSTLDNERGQAFNPEPRLSYEDTY